MYLKCHLLTGRLWIVRAFAPLMLVVAAPGQVPEKPVLGPGEVTGNNVYVRSGPSLNHYPICKLNAGRRVTIVAERSGWYEILPPEGTFSLISGDYVDTADNKTGVVNGNKVRVRAGSTLNKNMYTVQTMLSKGERVTILGRNPEGFLRIKPPPGANLWINREFVLVRDSNLAPANAVAQTGGQADKTLLSDGGEAPKARVTAGTAAKDASGAGTTREKAQVLAATVVPSPRQRELEEIDAASRTELTKPVLERDFGPLLERYRVIAEQEDDEFARQYARARVEQIGRMATMVDIVRRIRRLSDETDSKRREFLEDRAQIRAMLPPIPTGLDAQGELRISALYPPGSVPQRYRLVDSSGPNDVTIGYVEIPEDSTLDVDAFLGRYVGVRASAKRLQTGGVNAVPIYLAGELVLLQPASVATDSLEQD